MTIAVLRNGIWCIIYPMKRVYAGIATIFLPALLFFAAISHGQSPPEREIILSWQALNFFPANYKGKPLATPFSPVRVGVELIENGKFVDISQYSITWRLDNAFLGKGINLKETSFLVKKSPGDSHFVHVSVEKDGIKNESSIRIPVSPQTIVVDIPYPGHTIKADVENPIRAIPYFFNVQSLNEISFYWQVNERKEGGGSNNTLILKTGVPQTNDQRVIEITASAQNNKNLLEFAKSKVWLNVE